VLPSGTRQYSMHGWVAHIDNICVGHIHMQLEANEKLKFLDAWVHEDYRRQGIYRKLWETRWEYVRQHYDGWTAYAWAKPTSLTLLQEKGFKQGDTITYVEKDIERPFTFVSC
jgi:GNAT superfamily N-acetyltransferase